MTLRRTISSHNRNLKNLAPAFISTFSQSRACHGASLASQKMQRHNPKAAHMPAPSTLMQTTIPQSWMQQAAQGLHHVSVMSQVVPQPLAQTTVPPLRRGIKSKRDDDSRPQAPSKASGGVPNPTTHYLTQAMLNPILLPEPRRILIILDLNGTLLHRPNKRRPFNFIQRPHAKEFVDYCLETFYVVIWSSARPENVNKMVAQLLTPEQCEKCLLIWARDQFGLSPSDYDSRVQVYKRLTSIWANPRVMASHPLLNDGGKWDQTNTILVDDSIEKARSEPFNLLQVPEFAGLKDEPANVLPQVHDYLNSLCHQGDISRFVRLNPFKLNPSYGLHH